MLEQFVIVLHKPAKVTNVGGVVRVMKNMGFGTLRMVSPVPFSTNDVCGIAHRCEDIVTTAQVFDCLEDALADVSYVVGTTARVRGEHPIQHNVRDITSALAKQAGNGMVALLFGPEDNGLDNDALDRCHMIVRLPTEETYASLNLSHAVLLLCYEIRCATSSLSPTLSEDIHPKPTSSPIASGAEQEVLFAETEQALHAIEFCKSGSLERTMRMLRQIVYRAQASTQEIALLTAIAREVVKFLRRVG